LSPDEFRAHGHELIEWIARYLETIRDRRVLPDTAPGEVFDQLPASAPDAPEPFARIFDDFEQTILPGSTLWNHPRFFAYYSVSSTPPSILAELLAAAINQNGILWKSGPALTELEHRTLDWLRQWLELPSEFFGVIFDTASTSTLHALIAARQALDPSTREQGASPGMVVYTSEQAHSSVEKDALALGFGARHVRKIASDPVTFAMDPKRLAATMEADRAAGLRPCCVIPSIGATPAASIDPVAEILPIARAHGVWVHVDAAYAGPAAILDECRSHFTGWEQADSIVVNPHKWLLVNVDCSVFFTRRREVVSEAISMTPEYLRTAADPRLLNYMDYSIALGRRFRALKLWMAMRAYGREGAAAIIRQHIEWAKWLAGEIAKDERFEVAAPVHFSLVCFRRRGEDSDNQRILDTINASGFAFLSHTVLNGTMVLRLAIGNWMTTREDVAQTWTRIQELA
jgi:aromatic-L-amino-acid decarboxylase